MEKTADYWIRKLGLTAHPEGGYFIETYHSPDVIKKHGLPERYFADRACAKAIYFLISGDQASKFHRLECEEIWCYHFGDALTLYIIEKNGDLQHVKLGPNFDNGEQLQVVVPYNVWFGAKVNKKDTYTLVSCITAPGFDFDDFELAERQALIQKYPQHKELIEMLT